MPDYLTRHHWMNTYSKNMRLLDQASTVKLKKDHEEKMKSITEALPAIHPFANVSPEDSDSESEDSDDSKSDAGLGPLTKVPRGRPTKKRKRKGGIRRPRTKHPNIPGQLPELPLRTPPHCSLQNEIGHYAPKCTRPHT